MNASPDIADHPARILIVDDEPFNRQLLEVMLAPEGFHLLTAASGEEALAMVARQHPDLILLDIMMPGQVLEGEVASRTSELLLLTEREQSRRDQMRFKDEFLSHVSHELRTPLTAIKQFTSILLSGVAGELNQEQHEYQQIVLKNIQQLQSMIDDLLEVARVETAKLNIEPESVSVSEAVSDPLNTLQVTCWRSSAISSANPSCRHFNPRPSIRDTFVSEAGRFSQAGWAWRPF